MFKDKSIRFVYQFNSELFGSDHGYQDQALQGCANAILCELKKIYPDVHFESQRSVDPTSEFWGNVGSLDDQEYSALLNLQASIKADINNHWADWVQMHSETIRYAQFKDFKNQFELIFKEMVSDLKSEIFDWYKSEAIAHGIANPDLYAQNWLQGFDHGVRIDYSDRIDDKLKQEYGFSGDFVVLSGFGENDFLYSDSSESEIREFISQWLQFEYPEIEVE